ncbi:hypothetical protein PFICI_09001 [Pestalotiopsis fici W106-1]|uniref:Uncharacterized protein n=1 Tax=Pestalotiopsis fici (strain W106-1 / CGMCC3.15140) TaxID=1229662 RepID=W3WZ57_PESFW|nr:uncharacterized protein PFICI_09001 [Pestalotiopsis fici W106-1]ETS79148.1 hypothetical protein PFICI_09001 [Pestalotiopsis fici W106-1]
MTSRQFDEEKCRNVLVRYCGHVPRNYQYKDGIQQVFLLLRDHLGDEDLDLAGGVLYELIEIDCEHTHDPGAAFQRWRHDHMSRYEQSDLELPHVPHMMTITSSIVPTDRLSRWRQEHPDRYPFVLSDHKPLQERFSAERNGIRNRKPWLIENTFFVSSHTEGTLPLTNPNPKEFHEMQWRGHHGEVGRFLHEREISTTNSEQYTVSTPAGVATSKSSMEKKSRASRISLLNKFVGRGSRDKQEPDPDQRRRSWLPTTLFESKPPSQDGLDGSGQDAVPLPDGCHVPHAIFARKHLLVDSEKSLPSHPPINRMPIAESKATESWTDTTSLERDFRGPFTPQLGFDGGRDYRWTVSDCNMTTPTRRTTPAFRHDGNPPRLKVDPFAQAESGSHTRAKRRGFHMGYNNALDWLSGHDQTTPTQTRQAPSNMQDISPAMPQQGSPSSYRRNRHRWQNSLHLDHVQFVVPATAGNQTPPPNRKTTVVQVSPSPPSLPAVRRMTSIADDLAHPLGSKPSCLSNTSTLIPDDS